MSMTLAERIESALIDAENARDRHLEEMAAAAKRMEYQRGRIDAFRLIQQHLIKTDPETEVI